MDYFTTLQSSDLIELIGSTKKELFLSLPSLHSEVKDAINELVSKQDVSVHVLIDFDAQTIRQGYGDLASVMELLSSAVDVKTLKDNRIAFVISDDRGYYLFIESRSLIPADKATINAVKIDLMSMVRLKHFFFRGSTQNRFEDEMSNAIIEESKSIEESQSLLSSSTASVREISKNHVEIISDDLAKNPPLHPDYKRIVETYSTRFQYAKLEFKGSNISSRKIIIPRFALPIMNAELKKRMETKLNLFNKQDRDAIFKPLDDFKLKLEELRKEYLQKISIRDESILKKEEKIPFVKGVKALESELEKVKNDIVVNLAKQIEDTKKRLIEDLAEFFKANPKALFPENQELWNNEEYISMNSKPMAETTVNKIKWPMAHQLLDGFKIVTHYSDITYESLKDKAFIKEMKDIGLIKEEDERSLANYAKSIEVSS